MAQHQMEMIAEAAQIEFDLKEVTLQHRIGFVAAGEASLFLRVASAHRGGRLSSEFLDCDRAKEKGADLETPAFC